VFPTVGPKSVLLFGATELGFGSTPRFHRRWTSDERQERTHLTSITCVTPARHFACKVCRRLHALMLHQLLA
jgi:hypothetical protein